MGQTVRPKNAACPADPDADPFGPGQLQDPCPYFPRRRKKRLCRRARLEGEPG